MGKVIQTLLLLLLLAGCTGDGTKKAEEIFAEEASGVAVLLNVYYYEMRLPTGATFFFTGFDEDGDLQGLTLDRTEAERNPAMLTGTAFFVGKEGQLLTNRHVASPVIDKEQAKNQMLSYLRGLRAYLQMEMNQLSEQFDELEAQKRNYNANQFFAGLPSDEAVLDRYDRAQEQLALRYQQLSAAQQQADANFNPASIAITPVCRLGIAYNNSYVTNTADFVEKNPCEIVSIAQEENVDLALVRLKSRVTPKEAYIFSTQKQTAEEGLLNRLAAAFSKKNEAEQGLQINQQLYMIGYNAGLVLANTRKGIKVQMTGGKVTQLPDGERIVYSIPTMQGSSGSPVVDESGRLVAVNFAKLSGTDNFNFGIPLERVKAFLAQAGVH